MARPVVAFLAIGLLFASEGTQAESAQPLPVHDGVGSDFVASSSLARDVRLSEFRGKVVWLFFGYTSCQDVCPATMSHLQALTRSLGPAADAVQVLLVTVDPENDTAEHLRDYLARFDDRFIGLTGEQEDLARIHKSFMVTRHQSHGMKVTMKHNRSKAFVEDAYLYSHSQQIYLLDKAGRTRGFYFNGSPLEEMKEDTLALLAE